MEESGARGGHVLVVHGGAWAIPDDLVEKSVRGCEDAVRRGYDKLVKNGGSAVDAVEEAVVVLENDPTFDAGYGSVLNEKGAVEMDAMLMNGQNLEAGSVIGVSCVKNPIRLCRVVMDKTPHVAFSGAGAESVAEEFGIPKIRPEKLITEAARNEWIHFKKYGRAVDALFNKVPCDESSHDTVGAVCCTSDGRTAAATSTGGITAKRAGRVGDSPILGAGGYADDDVGAVSCTGHGESIYRFCLASKVLAGFSSCQNPQTSSEDALRRMRERVGGNGGVICVDTKGSVGIAHSTKRMAWAAIGPDGKMRSGITAP
eukprot:g328.t1